ncbi:hypothetical protein BCR37DRAFT_146888 [Protomyces lactucae-debilis]|uniref:Uncharacterized protein n=1 Tax=Protomyces lactucae-debilis TaxID=2754530 RepID=A0A1Y2FUC3_PROLT|nr:uncharacterized protein BCR37DRAFT_146888 [Protomyces lactucae-debilis]ORY87167.1 hypothetical protein BCR37DRAFT_146888 [Protomyces lactucae-debilis]
MVYGYGALAFVSCVVNSPAFNSSAQPSRSRLACAQEESVAMQTVTTPLIRSVFYAFNRALLFRHPPCICWTGFNSNHLHQKLSSIQIQRQCCMYHRFPVHNSICDCSTLSSKIRQLITLNRRCCRIFKKVHQYTVEGVECIIEYNKQSSRTELSDHRVVTSK